MKIARVAVLTASIVFPPLLAQPSLAGDTSATQTQQKKVLTEEEQKDQIIQGMVVPTLNGPPPADATKKLCQELSILPMHIFKTLQFHRTRIIIIRGGLSSPESLLDSGVFREVPPDTLPGYYNYRQPKTGIMLRIHPVDHQILQDWQNPAKQIKAAYIPHYRTMFIREESIGNAHPIAIHEVAHPLLHALRESAPQYAQWFERKLMRAHPTTVHYFLSAPFRDLFYKDEFVAEYVAAWVKPEREAELRSLNPEWYGAVKHLITTPHFIFPEDAKKTASPSAPASQQRPQLAGVSAQPPRKQP